MQDFKRNLVLSTVSLLFSGCGVAAAETPNSSNPVHCVAAFAHGRDMALRAKDSIAMSFAVQMTGRSLFEAKKMRVSGTLESGRREAEAFYARYGQDDNVMASLFAECIKKQDADPLFQRLNASGELMAAARKADSACRADAACSAGAH